MSDKPTRILLIEDNPGDVRLIREMLAEVPNVSYTFESAGRLSAGLEYLSKKQFDGILLDLGLPDSQGLDTLYRVHAKAAEIPIVVFTGLDDETVAIEAMHHGAEDYLVKGQIHGRALWRVLRYAIGRKQMEKALWESEERLKEAQKLGRIGNWEFDLDTQKILWSDEAYELYERDKSWGPPSAEEEAIYYAPEEAERLREFARIAVETGQKLEYELTAKLPSGKTAFFNATMCPVKDNEGCVIKLFGTVQDITERKQAEEKLRESEEQFRTSLENAPDGVYMNDSEGNFIYGNRKCEEITDYKREELIGKNFLELNLLPENSLAKAAELLRANIEGKSTGPNEFELIRKDGRLVPVEINTSVLQRAGQRIVLAFARDITERKQAEEALRQSEDRYRSILEEMEDSYFEVDLAGNMTFVNDPTCRSLGYSREELLGMNNRGFTAEEDIEHVYQAFNEAYRTGKPNKGFSWKIVRKDESIMVVDASISLLRDHQGNIIGFRGVGRDVTERKKVEEQMLMTSKLASVGELAAGVAHEINNPLTGVIGYAQLLMDRQDIPQDIKEDLEAIYQESQRAVKIVHNLLRFARRYKPDRDYLNMNDLIERTLALRSYELRTGNIDVCTSLTPDLPQIMADYNQIQQVILNIIINAEQAIAGKKRKGKITIETSTTKDFVRTSIADNGPGIPPELIAKIFDPFFTTKEVGSGSGLGLSICHGIITEHGGNAYVRSEPGKGATFVIELPAAVDSRQSAVEKEKKAAKVKSRRPKRKASGNILIVEDEPTIRAILIRTLSTAGYQTQAASSGKAALTKLAGNVYDLLITDLKMPGISGMELYETIKKKYPNLAERVVFITGDTVTPETHNFLVSTGRQYLSKPFNPIEITDIIEKALAEK